MKDFRLVYSEKFTLIKNDDPVVSKIIKKKTKWN